MNTPMTRQEWLSYLEKTWDAAQSSTLDLAPTNMRYSRKELNEFEQIEDGTWEVDRNG